MKCILRKGATLIERVSDELAASLFSNGLAVYKPKSDWRAQKNSSVQL